MNMAQSIDDFIYYLIHRRGSSRTTEITYKSILYEFSRLTPVKTPEELTIEAIDRVIDNYSLRGYKPKTFKNKVTVIRSFVKYLYARNRTSIRPERIELPRVKDDEPNFLTPEESQKLVRAAHNVRNRAMLLTLIRSGLRVSELVSLRYDDIYERSIVVRSGKGGKARVTFIDHETEQAIESYLEGKRRREFLFVNQSKHQMSRQMVYAIVKQTAERAGIEKKVTPHTLRHTFATNLLQNGARIEDVQPMMGHSNIQTTRIYMHFTNDYLHQRYDQFVKK